MRSMPSTAQGPLANSVPQAPWQPGSLGLCSAATGRRCWQHFQTRRHGSRRRAGRLACRSMSEDPLRRALCSSLPNALLLEATQLPGLSSSCHFVNLTNGLEALPVLEELGLQYSFVRIQSTALEQQKFEQMMQELDANLLLHLALGHSCLVWDAGSRHKQHGASRALWYGLEFIRYTLTHLWLPDQPNEAYLRGHRVSSTFDAYRRSFSEPTVRRLRYYQRYVPVSDTTPPKLRLGGLFKPSYHDTDVEYHVGLLHQHYSGPAAAGAVSGASFHAVAGRVAGVGDGSCTVRLSAAERSWQAVADAGWGLWLGGLSHEQFIQASA